MSFIHAPVKTNMITHSTLLPHLRHDHSIWSARCICCTIIIFLRFLAKRTCCQWCQGLHLCNLKYIWLSLQVAELQYESAWQNCVWDLDTSSRYFSFLFNCMAISEVQWLGIFLLWKRLNKMFLSFYWDTLPKRKFESFRRELSWFIIPLIL